MQTVYCGVDFHARSQTISYLKTSDGEIVTLELKHQNKEELRAFYSQFADHHLCVGLEASGYTPWFEELLEELGHEVWLGESAEIRRRARRRQKNDRRDAELILDLLIHDEFPRIHRPSPESREVLRMLRYRHKLVKIRTLVKNSLQSLANQSGLSLQSQLFTRAGQQRLLGLKMSAAMSYQRERWLALISSLDDLILQSMLWLKERAQGDRRVERLRTHPGIGLLSALAIVHTLEPVERFSSQRKVAAYGGFDPMERSSGETKHFLGISKAGSRLLRFLVIEAGQAAVKADPRLKSFYRRLEKRRGRPKAKVAVARKLLIRAYIMLRDGIDYAEFQRRGGGGAVAVRLAREVSRPEETVPVPLIGRPTSPAVD